MRGVGRSRSDRQFERKRRSSIRKHGRGGSALSSVFSCGLRDAFRAWGCVLLLFMGFGFFFQVCWGVFESLLLLLLVLLSLSVLAVVVVVMEVSTLVVLVVVVVLSMMVLL